MNDKHDCLLSGVKNHAIGLSMLIAEDMAEEIFKKNLIIEKTEKETPFVISDNPVIVINNNT